MGIVYHKYSNKTRKGSENETKQDLFRHFPAGRAVFL